MNLWKLRKREQFGLAKEVDIFTFATNSGMSLSELGLKASFSNCEWRSETIGKVGGGHGAGHASYSWEMSLDCDFWLAGHSSATIMTHWDLQAGRNNSWDLGHGRSTAFGAIAVCEDEVWSETATPDFTAPSQGSYSISFDIEKSLDVTKTSGVKFKGWGWDEEYRSSDSYLTGLKIKFE